MHTVQKQRTKGHLPKTENCLHVVTGGMSYEEVIKYISKIYNELLLIIRERFRGNNINYIPECKFRVNMPSTKTLNAKDFCFLWVPKEMFHMLLEKDYDGSYIDDTSLSPLEALRDDWTKDHPVKYIPPPFRFGDDFVYRPKFSKATVENRVSSDFIEGTLRCVNSPNHITERDMISMFSLFSRGTISVISYSNPRSKCFDIIFGDPDSSYFALYMMKKHSIKGYHHPLIFEHARKVNSRISY